MGFNEKGTMDPVPHKDNAIALPEEIQDLVRQVTEGEFSDTMFYDHTKFTMASVEMRTGFTEEERINKFVPAQQRLASRLREFVREIGLDSEFKVHSTTIATDVTNIHVGKDFAMQRAVAWLKQRRILPKKYITFGDSDTDFDMARQLHEEGMNVEHVHVGNSQAPEGLPFKVTVTNGKFNNGTKEFLQQK